MNDSDILEALLHEAEAKAKRRHLLGIVGAPGAGKSTFSHYLVNAVKAKLGPAAAVVVPMDGFHMTNAKLRALGIWELKGIPQSFEAQSFVDLLLKLKEGSEPVACPTFDRAIEEPTDGGVLVEPEHKLVVIEGNYLLLKDEPWARIKEILDDCWFLDSDIDSIEPRLLERHIAGGRTAAQARIKVDSTDLPNARLIHESACRASRVVKLPLLQDATT